MSVLAIQQLIYDLKRDKKLAVRWAANREDAVQGYELSAEEARAVVQADLAALYGMGVHPLLLAPFSRMAKLTREQYAAALAPLKGSRPFTSTYELASRKKDSHE
ncbi:MAG: hypothetical protein QHC78_03060 [Pigmentiphaga sp.]|uniref:hypothetical protein n=1 Tax=Pigmentiphaga sp. TaxID=1977564 RepID=UPI0029A689B1|nr:hypothetical protein [Pigmentiphaga sp.]MDX3904653.1 hypothetical protein [Pigmentiphaga sp.]